MISDIEFLETVCDRMQQVGLVQSKADFSARMLGKGPSYLTSMRAWDRNVPDEVMMHLVGRLKADINIDEMALACLADATARREHGRKHSGDMLDWVERHRALVIPEGRPQQQARHFPSIFARIARWWSRGQATTNRSARVELQ